MDLADVMEKRAGEQQITVDLRIVSADQVTGAEQRHHVIQQATNIGVMQRFRGGGVAVRAGNFRICHERLHQPLQVLVLETGDEVR